MVYYRCPDCDTLAPREHVLNAECVPDPAEDTRTERDWPYVWAVEVPAWLTLAAIPAFVWWALSTL